MGCAEALARIGRGAQFHIVNAPTNSGRTSFTVSGRPRRSGPPGPSPPLEAIDFNGLVNMDASILRLPAAAVGIAAPG